MSGVHADLRGLVLETVPGPFEVIFDGRTIWKFDSLPQDGAVEWPAALRPYLRGQARILVRTPSTEWDLGEVSFHAASGRISFTDQLGNDLVIDKWGLPQRPFGSRDTEVRPYLALQAERIVDVVKRDCDIQLWMAFGTLLGAVREHGVIASDSDVDLAYLSLQPSPAHMQLEMMSITRALTGAGYRVVNKTGSFTTVRLKAPDGALATIDIYTCFFSSNRFLATATLRADVPIDAILPVQGLPFEGRILPAPADPGRLLRASYGASWRTPDPDFTHQPGRDVIKRFDGWFGNWMRQRRDWEAFWTGREWSSPPGNGDPEPDFKAWVHAQLTPHSTVVDLGAGKGTGAKGLAALGHQVWALEYARPALRILRERSGKTPASGRLHTRMVNFYDIRDALSAAAMLTSRTAHPRAVVCRHVLDALPPDARENLWRAAAIILSRGGSMFAQYDELEDSTRVRRFPHRAGRQWALDGMALQREWEAVGAHATHHEVTQLASGARRCRTVLSWS